MKVEFIDINYSVNVEQRNIERFKMHLKLRENNNFEKIASVKWGSFHSPFCNFNERFLIQNHFASFTYILCIGIQLLNDDERNIS